MLQCLDSYSEKFYDFDEMIDYHVCQKMDTQWERAEVKSLSVAPLETGSSLLCSPLVFAPGISDAAISDTANNLGLALKYDDSYYPLRATAFKSLADRAKISGSSLHKLKKQDLASVLNKCLALHGAMALLLIRDEKVSAAHSGDIKDYSILPADELLNGLRMKLNERFPGYAFDSGYTDHCITSASWSLPGQRDEMLGTYQKVLDAQGKSALASKLMPGIRFCSSDTGLASAKVSALLLGLQHPIHIGGMLAVEHRNQSKVEDFINSLDGMFAQFGDAIAMLERLTKIYLHNPVNAMTAICKKLSVPKKAALEAIAMFECSIGSEAVTAHDVFMALQEIIFILRTDGETADGKLLTTEENIARALTLRWNDFDLAKQVSY
ncbi:MAG: hypothetical protein FWB97_09925 [Oscillospiraceae bacterium]|nr:hypothetical protein [Oscillospiraceae bacterium]